jgi:hypothetical protein
MKLNTNTLILVQCVVILLTSSYPAGCISLSTDNKTPAFALLNDTNFGQLSIRWRGGPLVSEGKASGEDIFSVAIYGKPRETKECAD